jgi:hypothetical protein
MKYFSIYIPDHKTNAGAPSVEKQQEMGKFVQASIERGEFISGGGFLSIVKDGAVVRRTNGKSTIVDGPYAESKEMLGGFAMLQYPSREEAIEGAKRFLEVAGDGECLTYQIMEGHE